MAEESSIARKLDSSIHGIIAFLGTLGVTWGEYLVRPDRIFKAIDADDGRRSQSFTLLTISAFLYAVLVGPYLYQPAVDSDSFLHRLSTYPNAVDVTLAAYENVKNVTVTSLILHAMPLLLAIYLGAYLFARIFAGDEARRTMCIKVLAAGFATQLFLLSLIQSTVLLPLDSIDMMLFLDIAYYFFYAYAILIPWVAYLAFDSQIQNKELKIYRKLPKYSAALVAIVVITVFHSQTGRAQQVLESMLRPFESVKLTLHPQFEYYRNLDTENAELVVYFSLKNDSDEYRLYDTSISFLIIHNGTNAEPIFSSGAKTLTSQAVRFLELPGRTTRTYSMHFPQSTELSVLKHYIPAPWYGDDIYEEIDLTAQLELTQYNEPDITKSEKVEGFSLRVITSD